MGEISIFQRTEKKYLISAFQKKLLSDRIGQYLEPDMHGKSTICSLYLDTPDHRLIRNSMEGLVYKEKLRLRSYGTPCPEDKVFLEIKKKYKGIVYKRRVSMTLEKAKIYLDGGRPPVKSQIMSEIDYAMKLYGYPKPAMMIAYEREAFFAEAFPNIRITFDSAIRYRTSELDLSMGSKGKKIITDEEFLMEIKTDGSMPLWLSHALDQYSIFPVSFSKYGRAYCEVLNPEKGEDKNVDIISFCG